MNNRQLEKLGVPAECFKSAVVCIASATKAGVVRGRTNVSRLVEQIVKEPEKYTDDPHFAPFVASLIEAKNFILPEPISYRVWGTDIDEGSHNQMRQACSLPVACGAAMMPDTHLGYGLCCGGVLATDNAVIPYAVGVDIGCRMHLSVLDLPPDSLDNKFNLYKEAIEQGTRFGFGGVWEKPKNHPVMDENWGVTRTTADLKDRAWKQLGTSGSGNHFVDFGTLTVEEKNELGLEPGVYVAVMSHSGSRGPGAAVCKTYHGIAQRTLPMRYEQFRNLAWLSLDTEAGQEYWEAMNLMGRFAAANHDVIHKSLSKLLGADIIAGVENHHNFAWKEIHNGKEMIVHRKGATPASEGELGVIPGSMGSPAFVVRGKGNPDSLRSASHGAGRVMSRTAAKAKYTWNAVKRDLEKKGIIVLSAGADEVPYVYKDIHKVMAEQEDLVTPIARFDPRIVKMSDDGQAED